MLEDTNSLDAAHITLSKNQLLSQFIQIKYMEYRNDPKFSDKRV